MWIFLIIFLAFYSAYFYLSYQVILLNDLQQIFSQTAEKAQEDLKQYSDLLLEDLGKCYLNIILIILLATLVTFVWILLLKYNAKLIIWLSIFSLPIILSVGLYYSIITYISLKSEGTAINGGAETNDDDLMAAPSEQTLAFDKALQTILTAELISYIRNETLWLVISIILAVILSALFIILFSLRERVRLSIALIRQASKAINGVKSTLLFPVIPRTVGIVVLIYGILISLLIISASHPTYHIVGGPNNGQPCHPKWAISNNRTANAAAAGLPPQQPRFGPNSDQQNHQSRAANSQQVAASAVPSAAPQVRFNGRNQQQSSPQATNRIQFPPINFQPPAPPASTSNQSQQQQQQQPSNQNQAISADLVKPKCVMNASLSRQHVWKYHAINLFATLWLLYFISGISQATLAGAFASYYWAYRKPQDVPYFAVTRSFYRTLRYHLGDIAFGSFLIATIKYIRIVIEFIDRRIRKKQSPEINNPTTRSVTCFLRIFFWIIDSFLKYIDRNAYIMMSMYGEGYFQSAKRAVKLLYKNSTRALVLDYVTNFVLLVSRLLITGLVGFVAAQEMFTADLHYKWLPIVLVVVGTYFISKGLFSVYSMAVDTLFMCFLIDSTNNDGSAERPYFMSKDLRRIVKRNTVIP